MKLRLHAWRLSVGLVLAIAVVLPSAGAYQPTSGPTSQPFIADPASNNSP